jgi:hypothetical protein
MGAGTRRDAVGGNDIAGEGGAEEAAGGVGDGGGGVEDVDKAAVGEAGVAEVAGEVAGVGEDGGEDDALDEADDFGVEEEEGPVAAVVEFGDDDGAAEGAAELVEAEGGAAGAAAVGEEVVGVEFVVAEEFVGGEVEVVGATFGDDVEDAAGGAAIFGGEAIGFDLELLDHVGVGVDDGLVLAGGGIGGAVEEELVRVGALAVDGVGDGGDLIDDEVVDALGVADAGDEHGEGVGVAAEQGEFGDLFVADDLADGGAFAVEEGDLGFDLDGFGEGAELHDDIEAGDLLDGEGDTGLADGVEAGLGDIDFVVAGGEGGEGVVAFGGGLGGGDEAGGGGADGNAGLGDNSAGGVGDAAGEGGDLGEERGAGESEGEKEFHGDGVVRREIFPRRRVFPGADWRWRFRCKRDPVFRRGRLKDCTGCGCRHRGRTSRGRYGRRGPVAGGG